MQEVDKLSNNDLYIELRNVLKIASKAARLAKLENIKHGIPKIFVRNGIVYYEFENGLITTQKPDVLKRRMS